MGTSPHGPSLEALNGKVTHEQIAPLDISKFNEVGVVFVC